VDPVGPISLLAASGGNSIYTVSQKKVAYYTLLNIFAQGGPIAKISTATESEIISENKCVINVLIFF